MTHRRRLRIAMVGQRGLPATYGGVERHVEEIGARLVEMGHEVVVYCRPGYTPDHAESYRGMRLRHLRTVESKHLDAIVHSSAATAAAIHDRADVVHYHALGPGLVAPLPRIWSRAKVVQTVHGLDQQRNKWGRAASSVLGLACWMSARVPDATIVVSRTLQEHYLSRYGRRTAYICNGVTGQPGRDNDSAVLQDLDVDPGRYVLFVGRLVPEKAPDLLVRAFARLEREDVRLVVAGGSSFTADYVDTLVRLAAQDPRVRLSGYVHGEDLERLYEGAAVFVLPSEVEGMPLTLLEAAARGVPVLASDIPPHREMVGTQGPGRRLFRSGDEADLVLRLEAMLDDLDTERAGAQDAMVGLHKEFDWDLAAEETARLYEAVMNGEDPTRTRNAIDLTERDVTARGLASRRRSVKVLPPRAHQPGSTGPGRHA